MSTAPRIEVEKVRKRFPGVRGPVLDDVSLVFERGERAALVGANGAGKTTLVRCLLGEYRHEGRVSIDGASPRAQRREVLRRVGFVPQLPPPLRMPAGQLIRFTAAVCGSDPDAIAAVAKRLGLDLSELARRPFAKLSGGQKQKLLISCALGRGCDLLLLDEPAANLDPLARRCFFELLAERIDRSTMLISSHRLDEVAALVGRVVELDRGRVSLDDRVDGGSGPGGWMDCRVVLSRAHEAAERALAEWGLQRDGETNRFGGRISGADRLRLLGTLARHSGAIAELHFETLDAADAEPRDAGVGSPGAQR